MILAVLISLASVGLGILLGLNAFVKASVTERIISPDQAGEVNADCILILGCRPQPDGTPSHMLEDRLRRAVDLWQSGAAPVILISGNSGAGPHGGRNEVDPMLRYLHEASVPESCILIDRESLSTFQNVQRTQALFAIQRPLIVTQKYHLLRALMIAQKLGMDAHGVASDYRRYRKPIKRHIREVLARCKDFAQLSKRS